MDFGISFGRGAEKRTMLRGCVVQTHNLLRKTSENLGRVCWSQVLVSKVYWFLSSSPTVQYASTSFFRLQLI